jgi:hypothetical protein
MLDDETPRSSNQPIDAAPPRLYIAAHERIAQSRVA